MTQESFETRTFALTVRDYAAYAFFGYYRGLLDVKVALLQVAATASIAFSLKSIFFGPDDDLAAMWPAIAFYPVIMLTLVPLIAVIFVVRSVKRLPNMTEAAIVSFTPDGFHIRRGELNAFLDWGAFKKVTETRKAIYLARRTEAHIVPKAAFASMEVARAAAAFARRSVRQAAGKINKGPAASVASPAAGEQVSPPFELTFGMFAHLFIRGASQGPGIVFLFIPCGMIALGAWEWRADMLDGDFDMFLWFASAAIIFGTLIALFSLLFAWVINRKAPTVGGQRRVAIAPGHIRNSGEGYDVQFPWSGVRNVVRSHKYLICYTRPRGFILVPASAFPTQAEADAFFDQAKAWADAARGK